jgi:transposase
VLVNASTSKSEKKRGASSSLAEQLAQTQSELAQTREALAQARQALLTAQSEYEKLKRSYDRLLEELAIAKKRLVVAKAERKDTTAEQLVLDGLLTEAALLKTALDAAAQAKQEEQEEQAKAHGSSTGAEGAASTPPAPPGKTNKPKGRRNLALASLPEERVELFDETLEGKAERVGFEESFRLGRLIGGMCRIVVARAIYKVYDDATVSPVMAEMASSSTASHEPSRSSARLVTASLPKELVRRGLLAPSMIAHILVMKYRRGMPFYRLEEWFTDCGAPLDRGTMCRYAEDVGATLGAIVLAARDEAFAKCFCLSTDATGVSIQPGTVPGDKSKPCRKGHFFVILADRDHVFFEYQPKHTSAAVSEMFKGYSGYIQADASAVYNALFKGLPPTDSEESDTGPPDEVGCWAHARTKFWAAAICKHSLGVEGLARINALFTADRPLWDLPPKKRHLLRQQHLRPLVDSFFAWAKQTRSLVTSRGLVATALGYVLRQEAPLRRFLDDGRLRLDNNAAERALRPIAVGRNAWLFFGSDDHASAAANLFSLFASCKLHNLDPEAYLTDVIRVMPYWPRDRYIELAPKYWALTRARLNPDELRMPLGHISVPPPLPTEQQHSTR